MHECDVCGADCYCHGDIDDMLMNGTREEAMCGHCPDGEDDFDEDNYYAQIERLIGEAE